VRGITSGILCGRSVASFLLIGLLTLAWSDAASARCGDEPGDAAAITAVRAAMEAQCPCAAATDRGTYVRCAKGVVAQAFSQGTLSRSCASSVKKCATKSTCGRPAGFVTCCATTSSGKTKCRVKSTASKCRAPSGGSACASGFSSCCDACGIVGCVPTQTPIPTATATATVTPTYTATPTVTNTPTVPAICVPNVPVTPIAQVPVTLAAGSTQCGGGMLINPPPEPPFAGSVEGDGGALGDLALGCLYSGSLPGLRLPDGATALLDVTGLTLLPLSLTLGGSEGTGPTDCTKGAGPGRKCAKGLPGIDGTGTCNFDSDCGNAHTACAIEPNCFFGPPIPVFNGPLSACVISAFQTDLCGQVNLAPPSATFATALSSRVYLTANVGSPCPRCESGVCNGGANVGEPCTPVGSLQTSIECPPVPASFIAILNVTVPELTSGTSTLAADDDGIFCDGQTVPGAFGIPEARTVTETGSGPTLNGLMLEMSLAGTFCIAPNGTQLESIAGLPGVGALSAVSLVDVSGVLLP
jgi:hypothetical protein